METMPERLKGSITGISHGSSLFSAAPAEVEVPIGPARGAARRMSLPYASPVSFSIRRVAQAQDGLPRDPEGEARIYSATSGTVDFVTALAANGGSTYFSLEEALTPSEITVGTTPEPNTFQLFGSGALGLAGTLRRRFVNK